MPPRDTHPTAAMDAPSRRLFVYSGGFLRERRVRRILSLAGWKIRLGRPRPDDTVAVWGQSPTSHRGEAIAARHNAGLLRVEDAFLRSVHPGRTGAPATGLLLDRSGVHFDPSQPSDLEQILTGAPFDDHALLTRARDAMDRMRHAHLSKYNAFDPAAPVPAAPYVLVIDQTRGDASVTASGATPQTFREMLVTAQIEHPGLRVLIKTHPETQRGLRPGYFGPEHAVGPVSLVDTPVSPWALLEGAVAVYTVSSGMGFEAILAGHKPRVFGQPFYAGWGLTQDENPVPRRTRRLTRAQLFAGAMITYPTWYDPCTDQLCEIEDVLGGLEARARAAREDGPGYVAVGMRPWKRRAISRFFAQGRGVAFADGAKATRIAAETDRRLAVWASKAPATPGAARIEDGFIRSRGLGAALTPPLSLVCDDLGIYYDPRSESALERHVARSMRLPQGAEHRAEALIRTLVQHQITKYNLGAPSSPDLPKGRRILVPGQVEDDASIRFGAGDVATNLALLEETRRANPDAVLIYKPHPDVEAGLRDGVVDPADLARLADVVARDTDAAALIDRCDAVWTMTSTLGFEALLRGKPVTCLGVPFYAGWGLTHDLASVPDRRQARPTLAQFVHAALIDYPRYFDPVSGRPASVECVLDRIASGDTGPASPSLRLLSRVQGVIAPYTTFWR